MTTVTNTLLNVASEPLNNVFVEICLLAPVESSNVFTETDAQIASRVNTKTDNNGTWTLDLFPNATLAPSNSIYKVTHHISGFFDQISYFRVPINGATPVAHSLQDLLVAIP